MFKIAVIVVLMFAAAACNLQSQISSLPTLSSAIVGDVSDADLKLLVDSNIVLLEQPDDRGATPLMYALGLHYNDPDREFVRDNKGVITRERASTVEYFLKRGSNPNVIAAKVNANPLTLAALHGWTTSLSILLRYGANQNAIAGDATALKTAAHRCYEDIAKLLLAAPAAIAASAQTMQSARDAARFSKCTAVERLIEQQLLSSAEK